MRVRKVSNLHGRQAPLLFSHRKTTLFIPFQDLKTPFGYLIR